MAIYKVSYVIIDKDNPGTILNQNHAPVEGEIVQLGEDIFEIVEVLELVPPRGEFHYIHVTCKAINTSKK